MKKIVALSILTVLFASELEVDGNLKVSGNVIFQDETTMNTAILPIPSGTILPFGGQTSPNGWLLCYGQEISREIYFNLYSSIGDTYGSGNGSETFNVPDLRGRMMLGADNMGGVSANRVQSEQADNLGGSSGEENHQLLLDELPSRNAYDNHSTRGQGDSGGSFSYVHNLNTSTIGNNQPHNNMPPYITVNYIIKL